MNSLGLLVDNHVTKYTWAHVCMLFCLWDGKAGKESGVEDIPVAKKHSKDAQHH